MSPRKAARKPKKATGTKAKAKSKAKAKAKAKPKKVVSKKAPARAKVPARKAAPVRVKASASTKRTPAVPRERSSGSLSSTLSPTRRPRPRGTEEPFREEPDLEASPLIPRGTGSDSGGQSGSDQGLSEEAEADSESVEELVKEGQDYEAEIIGGVEEAGNAVEAGVPQRKRKNEFEVEDLETDGEE